eukprot:CAMPEP_0176123830 /NCGR_PEP_ID=MMETSP0120_2-20121206/62412_1 /TAXON_ID=160619 /ORGANISM="Kryptoperidinium foliaceum, Strain CCMP 1326" /LENGTH=61 /DNA_ID=CAMNT_0017458557 /DNA_START=23 /DNA_END=205 /DNA_ORIENTATION=-
MAEVFYQELLGNLPAIGESSDSADVLKTYRQHVKEKVNEAMNSLSAFALAWGAHALLNASS